MSLIFFLTFLCTCTFSADWDYGDNGPSQWNTIERNCAGTRQSPIDIRSSNVQNAHPVCPDTHRNIRWDFNINHNMWQVENNGHSLLLKPVKDASGTTLSRGNTVSRFSNELFDEFKNTERQQYCLDQVHFHIGRDNCEGSEHYIEGKSFPLEIHWVHSLCEYPGIVEAIESGKENALSVIGMFFEVSSQNVDNPSLATFINEDNINDIIEPYSTFILDDVSMRDLLPCDDGYCGMVDENFWFYDGSLTTPGCFEIVRWQVFEQTSFISKLQLQLLRRMQQPDGTQFGVTGTFRPPQYATNNRPLNYVYQDCTN